MTAETATAPLSNRRWVSPSSLAAISVGAVLASSSVTRVQDQELQATTSMRLEVSDPTREILQKIAGLVHLSLEQSDLSITALSPAPPVWPINATQLFDVLQTLRSNLDQWDQFDGAPPSQETLRQAEKVLALLPPSADEPKIGFGGEGDLYFSWENMEGTAFLTIDGTELHLLIKPTGKPPIYHDNLANDQKILSNQVLPALAPFFTTPPAVV